MDNFDLKKYIAENRINRKLRSKNQSFSSDGYQIISVEPTNLQGGKGFLPIQFSDFSDVKPNEYDSVYDFIQNSIYETFQDSNDSINDIKREIFMKKLKKDREKCFNKINKIYKEFVKPNYNASIKHKKYI